MSTRLLSAFCKARYAYPRDDSSSKLNFSGFLNAPRKCSAIKLTNLKLELATGMSDLALDTIPASFLNVLTNT